MNEEEYKQKIFVLEQMLNQKRAEIKAYKTAFEEQQKKAEYYKRIVKWYRRNRSDNLLPKEPI